MTGRRIPMSTFDRHSTADGGEDYIEYLKRKDVKVVRYVIVAETHSPAGTQVTTIRERGTEDEACDLLRRALADQTEKDPPQGRRALSRLNLKRAT